MFPSIAQTWPQMMYHAIKPPCYAKDTKEKDALARQGWSPTYIRQEYPRMMFHPAVDPRKAADPAEQADMEARGWTTTHELVKLPSHEMNADGKMVPVPDRHLPIPRAAGSGLPAADRRLTQGSAPANGAIAMPTLAEQEMRKENELLKKLLDDATQPRDADGKMIPVPETTQPGEDLGAKAPSPNPFKLPKR